MQNYCFCHGYCGKIYIFDHCPDYVDLMNHFDNNVLNNASYDMYDLGWRACYDKEWEYQQNCN